MVYYSPTAYENSELFAVRIVNMYKYLTNNFHEYDLFKQVLRSGTSIAANLAESEYAISKREFLFKKKIALKEANETRLWLRLLYKTGYIQKESFDSIYKDCNDIFWMLHSSVKTLQEEIDQIN